MPFRDSIRNRLHKRLADIAVEQQKKGYSEYQRRVLTCHERTAQWFSDLKHLDGGKPGIVICDRDLSNALGALGLMSRQHGQKWTPPRAFVSRVGVAIEYLGVNGLVLAHPSILNYDAHSEKYTKAITDAIPAIISLARFRPIVAFPGVGSQ